MFRSLESTLGSSNCCRNTPVNNAGRRGRHVQPITVLHTEPPPKCYAAPSSTRTRKITSKHRNYRGNPGHDCDSCRFRTSHFFLVSLSSSDERHADEPNQRIQPGTDSTPRGPRRTSRLEEVGAASERAHPSKPTGSATNRPPTMNCSTPASSTGTGTLTSSSSTPRSSPRTS